MVNKYIRVYGARENNLKNIDVAIPRDKMVVFTGLSGSGKSSLAFDTIYAEGHRRFVVRCRPTRVCSWDSWISRMSTASKVFHRPFRSTRRPPRKIRVPPSERSRKSTIICAFCTPGAAHRTARSAARRSSSEPSTAFSTKSWNCPKARNFMCLHRSSSKKRAHTQSCLPTC